MEGTAQNKVLLSFVILMLWDVAVAFDVRPLGMQLRPDGNKLAGDIEIFNPTSEALPVEISVHQLELDPNNRSPRRGRLAEDELMVFPPAALIGSGEAQSVRVQWLGAEDAIEQARSYLIVIEQLPVNDDDGEEGVQMVLTFNAVVHVANTSFAPELSAELLPDTPDQQNRETPVNRVNIRNDGNGIAFGESLSLEIVNREGDTMIVGPEQLDAESGEIFIPPRSSQIVHVIADGIFREVVTVLPLYER